MFSIATAFIAALTSAPASLPYTDVRSTDAQGREIIVRSSEFPDLSGGTVIVEQRLRPLGDGSYEIDARNQSKATLLYHLALCEDKGMKPHQGVGTLSGDMAVGGFTCYSETRPETLEELQGRTDEESHTATTPMREDRAADYVIARAASGSAPVGINFYAAGVLRMVSSVAGQYSYRISVDNLRCRWGSTEFSNGAPFQVDVDHGVTCIGHRPGFLTTVTEGCVPKTCGRATGTWSISGPRLGHGLRR